MIHLDLSNLWTRFILYQTRVDVVPVALPSTYKAKNKTEKTKVFGTTKTRTFKLPILKSGYNSRTR